MALFRIFSQKGWRRTGAINVVVAYVCAIILLVFFSISVSQSSLSRPTIIFEGNCTSSARLNFFFHLLINILSGVVLASSNFFMQVLTSPSRKEIDEAHSWLRSLDIGIPSVGNLYHVSRFKSASWLVLFLSSIPIHLFFNSAIFQTLYMRSQWQLTLATEAFTKGAAFYPPGASLSPAGSAGPGYHWSAPDGYYKGPDLSDTTCSQYTSHGWLTNGYGTAVPLDDYSDATSVVRRNISSIAREAHSWTFLDAKKCQAEYMSCAPRVNYGDVVVVIDNGDSLGWPRSLVFDFDPNSNLTYWDTIVPPESANSLWFSAQCAVTRDAHSWDTAYCTKTCTGALGLDPPLSRYQSIPAVQEHWLLQFFPETRCGNTSLFGQGVTYNTAFDTLRVSHCLAQPTTPKCKIGLSNALLLVVVFCIFPKATQGAIVVWKLQHESLVTPGDAIQSFISHPDIFTRGLGTLDIVDSQHLEFGRRRRWHSADQSRLTTTVQPRLWGRKQRRISSIIPFTAWVHTYIPLLAGLGLLSAGLSLSSSATNSDYTISLEHVNGIYTVETGDSSHNYITTLLLANTPQLIFSFCYFLYNAFITRLQVEKEWNSLGRSYQPLRVSYPSGEQVSSYRLQLPYYYSIPLMGLSIGLHWLASNAIFLIIADGGYLTSKGDPYTELQDLFQISAESFIALGYSPGFILICFLLSLGLIILLPIILSFQRLKVDMVAGGSNSLVISAACHIMNPEDSRQDTASPERVLQMSHSSTLDTNDEAELAAQKVLNPAQKKLRWGAILLTRAAGEFGSAKEENTVSHLGFGGKEYNISTPKEGEYYV